MLERINAEGVFDLKRRELAVRTIGLNEEFVLLFEEPRMDAEIVETGIIEIPKHGSDGGVLHGMLVLGLLP
ncbi:hypothetical protein AAFX91_10305 [Bradyrhizobium sp. 31Argb]|uniref:hypothetical protein n=1 Tax=Bradyrhizobium sp. 31Argb TaxID=3141247 RepID=UPI0037495DF7